MDLLVHINVEGSLDEGQGHLEGFDAELGAVVSDELQSLNPHQSTVAGGILLQILWKRRKKRKKERKKERAREIRIT